MENKSKVAIGYRTSDDGKVIVSCYWGYLCQGKDLVWVYVWWMVLIERFFLVCWDVVEVVVKWEMRCVSCLSL